MVVSKGPCKHQILPLNSLKPYKTNKNRWVLTFLQWKIVCIIVRPHRWFLRMTTNLNKCRTTCFDVLRALENFKCPWMKIVDFKILIFDQILPKFRFWRAFETLKSPKSSSGDVFVFKNCLKRRMMFLFASECFQGSKLVPNNLFWCS